jgi:hypothetical protein
MDKHVKILGLLHLVAAGFNILAGLLMLAFLAAIRQMFDIPEGAGFIGWLLGIVPLFLIVVSLPGLLAGMGLLNREPWARILAMIVGVFHIPNIPIGTGLGIYTFWVLLNDETAALFDSQ